MRRRISRRRVLAASVPVAVGLAGCGGGGGGETDPTMAGGTGAPDGSETTTARPGTASFPELSADDPTYRRWQPGTGDVAGLQDAAYNIGRVRGRRDALPAGIYERRAGWAMFNGYVGVAFDELDGMMQGLRSRAAVYLGSFGRDDVTERLAGLPYEQFERTDGVDYYRWDRTGATTFVGVSDAAVVAGPAWATEDDPAGTFVAETTSLFATAAGERPRLHEESELYARYTDAVGWPLYAWVDEPVAAQSGGVATNDFPPGGEAVPEDVGESVRTGVAGHVADGAVVDRYWLWTTDDGPASPADVRAAYENPVVRRAVLTTTGGDEVAVRADGRVVEVAVLDRVTDPGGGTDPPLVAVEATVDGGTLTLEHHGGDPLPLGQVTVPVGDESLSLGAGELRPGESASVDLPDGAAPQAVVYSPPAADVTTIIAKG